jgi:exopolysaccharide biosynthesis polyprenyl glycosylphosphotransferase
MVDIARASLRGTGAAPDRNVSTVLPRPWLGRGDTSSTATRRLWFTGYLRRAVALDALVAIAAGGLGASFAMEDASLALRLATTAAMPFAWVVSLVLCRGYERRFVGVTAEEYRAVGRAVVLLAGASAAVAWAGRLDLARSVVFVVAPVLFLLGLLGRKFLRRRLAARRLAGRDTQRTVVIGNIRTVGPMIRQLQAAPGEGMHVVGACVSGITNGGDFSSEVEGIPVFGYPEEALHAIDLLNAEVVAVSGDPDLSGRALRRLAWSLEERAVDLVVATGLLDVAGPRLSIRPAAGMPLLHVERPAMSGARRVVKRAVDWCLALGLTIAALPVLVAIGIAIRLDSSGPVLFRQTRVGARGETFSMLKFRSMGVDAEQRLAQLTESADAGNTVLFKMRHDPRITRVGGFLRRYSLDELPQLVNVLRGEMSLVGPRPPLPAEVAGYESDAVRRLRVRPGLTGLWQVSGRSDLSWDESLRLDLWYVDNWSLVLDLQIIVRTARAVLRGKGAY